MRNGLVFIVFALVLSAAAVSIGGFAWALLWPAIAFGAVGCAYVIDSPAVFGKRPTGDRAFWSVAMLMPFTTLNATAWWAAGLTEGDEPVELVAGVWIGRRPTRAGFAPAIRSVVDLTCEWQSAHPSAVAYVSAPILDGGVPTRAMLAETVSQTQALPRPVLIHCGQGHQRTGLVAAALLLANGTTSDTTSALSLLASKRPGAVPNAAQHRLLADFARTLVAS